MVITISAIIFIVIILIVAYFGLRYVMNQGTKSLSEVDSEKCSLCRKQFPKKELLVREVYDVKVYFFCKNCTENLYKESVTKYSKT
ncbi:MAG: hypothetical protein FJ218_11165 [Ignavibacteria bacterium]|nr:hypothetical protein [Ignavibacteria bacterium]